MWQKLLTWLLSKSDFRIYSNSVPVGRRLGGFDIQGIPDTYINIEVLWAGQPAFRGYFQKS